MRLKIRENNVQKHFISKKWRFCHRPPPWIYDFFVGLPPTLESRFQNPPTLWRVVCSVLSHGFNVSKRVKQNWKVFCQWVIGSVNKKYQLHNNKISPIYEIILVCPRLTISASSVTWSPTDYWKRNKTKN